MITQRTSSRIFVVITCSICIIICGISIIKTVCHCKINNCLIPVKIRSLVPLCYFNWDFSCILIFILIFYGNRKFIGSRLNSLFYRNASLHQCRIEFKIFLAAKSCQICRYCGCLKRSISIDLVCIDRNRQYIIVTIIHCLPRHCSTYCGIKFIVFKNAVSGIIASFLIRIKQV